MTYLRSAQKIGLGLTLVEPGRGGIASVARMSARALSEAGKSVNARSYLDKAGATLPTLPAIDLKPAGGSRAAFMAGLYKDALSCDYFLYDSVGMARAHPKFILPPRDYGVWIHGIEVWNSLTKKRERALKNASFVLVNSAFTLEKFQDIHFPLSNAHVCHLATEDETLPKLKPSFDGPPTTLMIGRIDALEMYKGYTEVILAWKTVLKAVPDARLVIVGDGSGLPRLEALIQKENLSNSIELTGFISGEKLEKLWPTATCFALPSRGEGFGLVYVEAMRHGLPVIASLHDAGQEVNAHDICGFNVNLDKKNALEEKLITLLSDLDLAKKMGANGYQRWMDNFRYSAFKERLLKAVI